MKSSEKILRYIERNGPTGVSEISEKLNFSRQYVHKLINELEESNQLKKNGMPPRVFYSIAIQEKKDTVDVIDYQQEKFLQEHFILIDALGQMLEGLAAMKYWCDRQNLTVHKTIEEFMETRKKYLDYYEANHLINGFQKLKNTSGIGSLGVDQLYYLDFYAIERFGKTRLGTLMHYAKQGQNKSLMKMIVNEIKQRILKLISDESITAIVYVPPTIKRELQIMDFLKKHLAFELQNIKVEKLKSPIIVPQKALSKIFERVANAKNTFFVPHQKKVEHLLIIDDAIGSGATINEIALKIKEKNLAIKITGLAITGSYKGFEVISEL